MDHLTIPMQLANAIRQYLGTRPFDEVAGMIAALGEAASKRTEAAPAPASAD